MNHWCLNSSLVYIYIYLSPYSFRRIKTQSCSRCSSGTTRASLPTTATCSLGKACWPICRSWGGTALMLVWRFWRLSMRRTLPVYCSCMLFPRGFGWIWHFLLMFTSSAAQGGGGSFKNRKPIGEVGCCESGMAERSHWLTERWLELCLLEWLQWLQWSPHPQLLDVVWCTATVVVVVA